MKKVIIISTVLLLSAGAVFAASDNGNQNQEQVQTANINSAVIEEVTVNESVNASQEQNQVQTEEQGENDGQNQEQVQTEEQNQINNDETIGVEVQERARDREQLQIMIEEKQAEHQIEVEAMKEEKQQQVYQNQNTIRGAVHALLAAEDLVGGIGPQVSVIAQEFNNSVDTTIKAEEKIKTRSGFARFFMGGDDQTADEILQLTVRNRNQIQELNQLHQDCDCDPELKLMIQEQINNMEQEQDRLGELANQEKEKKGLFGWMFGWLVN